jgi:hypothetical protein
VRLAPVSRLRSGASSTTTTSEPAGSVSRPTSRSRSTSPATATAPTSKPTTRPAVCSVRHCSTSSTSTRTECVRRSPNRSRHCSGPTFWKLPDEGIVRRLRHRVQLRQRPTVQRAGRTCAMMAGAPPTSTGFGHNAQVSTNPHPFNTVRV